MSLPPSARSRAVVRRATAADRARAEGGFTLLEVTVVIGLLAGFLVLLTQLLSSSVELFDEGETGQEVADVANAAAAAARASIEDMVGPVRERYLPGPPDARLIVEWVPLGLSRDPAAPRVQALRATVRLDPQQEERLIERALRAEREGLPGSPDGQAPSELEAAVRAEPRRGRGEMLLLPWPAPGGGGAFLELRRGLWLPGERIPIDRRRDVALMEIEHLAGGPLPAERIAALTEPIATGLLHFELELGSQYTRAYDRAPGEGGGPEWVWDSARAGLLAEAEDARERFSLDLGPFSLENPTDDVFPREVRLTLVVARVGREALLARELAAQDDRAPLLATAPLPDPRRVPLWKIGPEWVHANGFAGDTLIGLRRGRRGTVPAAHPRGTEVRTGKTVRVVVPLAHARDNWNG